MTPPSMIDPQTVIARYDALRASGSTVVWCEGAILVEFGLHPSDLHRMLSEDAYTRQKGTP